MKEITPDKDDKTKSDHGDKNVKSKKTKKEGFLSKVSCRQIYQEFYVIISFI